MWLHLKAHGTDGPQHCQEASNSSSNFHGTRGSDPLIEVICLTSCKIKGSCSKKWSKQSFWCTGHRWWVIDKVIKQSCISQATYVYDRWQDVTSAPSVLAKWWMAQGGSCPTESTRSHRQVALVCFEVIIKSNKSFPVFDMTTKEISLHLLWRTQILFFSS